MLLRKPLPPSGILAKLIPLAGARGLPSSTPLTGVRGLPDPFFVFLYFWFGHCFYDSADDFH